MKITESQLRNLIREEIKRNILSEDGNSPDAKGSSSPKLSSQVQKLDDKLGGNLKSVLTPIFKEIGKDKNKLSQALLVILDNIATAAGTKPENILSALNQAKSQAPKAIGNKKE